MATSVLRDCKLYYDGYDLSGDMNMLGINHGAAELDDTTFGATTESRKGGLKQTSAAFKGLYQAGTNSVDAVLHPGVGANKVLSISPEAGADGEVAFAFQAMHSKLMRGASIGELLVIEGEATAQGGTPLIRGRILHPAATTVSGIGSGTGRQVGAVSATQKLYASLHVLEVGTTVTVKVQSDDNSAFTSATDRITFTAATAVGAQWSNVAGAVTDDWWRVNISAITGSARFVVVAGII